MAYFDFETHQLCGPLWHDLWGSFPDLFFTSTLTYNFLELILYHYCSNLHHYFKLL